MPTPRISPPVANSAVPEAIHGLGRIRRPTLPILLLAALCAFTPPSPAPAAEPAATVVSLWPGEPPEETGGIGPERERLSPALDRLQVEVTEPTRMITGVTRPTVTVLRPIAERETGTAIVICPGGGYWNLYWQLEGEEVAAWLNSVGVTGILLKYRVPRRPDEPEREPARRPLQDVQRAIRLVRGRAAEWGIDPERIGVMGFSAGGHLAVAAATNADRPAYAALDGIDAYSSRPNFAIPVYAGYLKSKDRDQLASGIRIPPGTPPMFLVHGGEDLISPPEGTVLLYLALKQARIPAELHIYSATAHDFGVRSTPRPYAAWTSACAAWLKDQGFLRRPEQR